jgi:hypothetical protein
MDDADTELHARAFIQHKWVTGFLPLHWTNNINHRTSFREEQRPRDRHGAVSLERKAYRGKYRDAFKKRASQGSFVKVWRDKFVRALNDYKNQHVGQRSLINAYSKVMLSNGTSAQSASDSDVSVERQFDRVTLFVKNFNGLLCDPLLNPDQARLNTCQ